MCGKMILLLTLKIHSSASNQDCFFFFLNLEIQWIPKTSGIKCLKVKAKKKETVKFYIYYMCLLRNDSNVIFLIVSLLICTNFKSACLSIKLFYFNSHKLLSLLCTPSEMIKLILSYPKLKMFYTSAHIHNNTKGEFVLVCILHCLIFKDL